MNFVQIVILGMTCFITQFKNLGVTWALVPRPRGVGSLL